MPRDELRMSFKHFDHDGDDKITYEEILPHALESADKKGVIVSNAQRNP